MTNKGGMGAKDAAKAASEEESLRELYMALTRAEDCVGIFGKGRSGRSGGSSDVGGGGRRQLSEKCWWERVHGKITQ